LPSPSIDKVLTIKEPTLAEQFYLNAMGADLEDDDTLPTCDMTDCSDDDASMNDEFDDSEYGNDHTYESCKEQHEESTDNATKSINESKYDLSDIDQVVRSCTHLDVCSRMTCVLC
jgi:hypothetical protein